MSRLLCTLCLMAFLPIVANATSTSSITNTSCSGSLTTSLLDGASFACAGNLTLDGGFITSDSLINISADGDLFLDNLTFTAPNVTFSVLTGALIIGSGIIVNTSTAIIQNTTKAVVTWNELNIPQGSGAVLTIGDGKDLKVSPGSGYVLNLGSNTPVVGGTLIIGSGSSALITTGVFVNDPAFSVAAVPEPSTYAMMLLGLIALRRRV